MQNSEEPAWEQDSDRKVDKADVLHSRKLTIR